MQLIEGFMAVLHPATLFLIIGGVVAGIVFGAIPGLSAFTALALFLPITFGMTNWKNCLLYEVVNMFKVNWMVFS